MHEAEQQIATQWPSILTLMICPTLLDLKSYVFHTLSYSNPHADGQVLN